MNDSWRERDRRVLWHPFTQHQLWEDEAFPIIVGGEGVWLQDAEGRRWLDGVSSLWVNVHGHRRAELDAAVSAQLGRLAHSTFLGLSHPPGIELAERLLKLAPPGLARVFYSDSGSTAVEVALKMASQYWRQTDPPEPNRTHFLAFTNAYHGDTIGSVSLGGMDLFHATYRALLFSALRAPAPYCYRCPLGKKPDDCADGRLACLDETDKILSRHAGQVAAVVVEPLVQGAAGMLTQPPGFVSGLRKLCDRHRTLLIADEVATGFGRTGTMFACEQEGVSPDLLCLGKGLTGGYLPLAATLATEKIFSAFYSPVHGERTFFHGHSYTANPLGCAAALANLDLFERDRTLANVAERSAQLAAGLAELARRPHVGEVRQRGLMVGLELVKNKSTREPYNPRLMMGRQVMLAARKAGVIIRPLSDVVVLMPPLCIGEAETAKLLDAVGGAIADVTGG